MTLKIKLKIKQPELKTEKQTSELQLEGATTTSATPDSQTTTQTVVRNTLNSQPPNEEHIDDNSLYSSCSLMKVQSIDHTRIPSPVPVITMHQNTTTCPQAVEDEMIPTISTLTYSVSPETLLATSSSLEEIETKDQTISTASTPTPTEIISMNLNDTMSQPVSIIYSALELDVITLAKSCVVVQDTLLPLDSTFKDLSSKNSSTIDSSAKDSTSKDSNQSPIKVEPLETDHPLIALTSTTTITTTTTEYPPLPSQSSQSFQINTLPSSKIESTDLCDDISYSSSILCNLFTLMSNQLDPLIHGSIQLRQRSALIDTAIRDHASKGSTDRVAIINDPSLMHESGVCQGSILYTGCKRKEGTFDADNPENLKLFVMDPQFADHLYSTLKVKVPYKFLNWENDAIKARAVWGTDVYTDDSDIVAAAIHCGKYATTTCKSHHSLIVTLKILPQLKKYFSSVGFGLESRQWGHSHDGVSFMVIDSQIILDTNIGLKRKSGSLEYNMLKKSEREMSDDKKRVVRGFD